MTLHAGLSADYDVEVRVADTADALGSGSLEVLGTPRVVALFEQATVRAIAGHLDPGQTTVGVKVVVRHRRPSLVGAQVRVSARLVEVADGRLGFEVFAHEGAVLVADGTVRRVIVDADRFLARAAHG